MSFLSTLRSATYSVAETYRAANPSVLAHVYPTRPGGTSDVPFAYVSDIRTTLQADSGTRMWTGEVDLVIADSLQVNDETEDRLDTIAAALTDAFSDAPHAYGSNTVGEPIGLASTEIEVNNVVTYAGRVLTIGRIQFTEGR